MFVVDVDTSVVAVGPVMKSGKEGLGNELDKYRVNGGLGPGHHRTSSPLDRTKGSLHRAFQWETGRRLRKTAPQ